MDYKNELKKAFEDQDYIEKLRYDGVKSFFGYATFLFFMNFFFVGAQFYDEIFTFTLPVFYYVFLTSFCFYIYLYLNKTFELTLIKKNILKGFLFLVFVLLGIPFYGII